MNVYELSQGNLPILVSMPHNGILIPDDIAASMQPAALAVADTDWFMDKLYQFALELGCSLIKPNFSRYVIDLNRSDDNQSLYPGADTTELCPTTQFDRSPIYLKDKQPTMDEINRRTETYWKPYHQQLERSLKRMYEYYGYVLLFEAHSIKSVVPRFFEGQLPDFNFGNNALQSSSKELTSLIQNWQPQGYSKVFNGRFKGGHITRHYGRPEQGIDSLQLELSQATYLDENRLEYDENKSKPLIHELEKLFQQLINLSIKKSQTG